MLTEQTLKAVLPILILGVILTVRMRRARQIRPLRLERLWIVPVIYLAITTLFFVVQPPHLAGWLASAVALLVGAALGWQRGRMMQIYVDPETHEVSQQGSLAALLFLLGLIGIRTLLREAALLHVGGLQIDVNMVTEMLIALALGLLSVQRLEMYLRGTRLVEAARGARVA